MWETQPGTWKLNSTTQITHGSVSSANAFFRATGPILTEARAETLANPDSNKTCDAAAIVSAVYEFKRVWRGAGAPMSEDFEFTIVYTPDWNLMVSAPEGGQSTAKGTIKVVIRNSGKEIKTYPTAVKQPISAPPPQQERAPQPPQAVNEKSPKISHSNELDLEVEVEVTSNSEAASRGSSASSFTSVTACSVT